MTNLERTNQRTNLEWATTQVKTVRRIIDEADDAKKYLVFVDRNGTVDSVSDTPSDEVWKVWNDLHAEARMQSGGAYFVVLSISGGVVAIEADEYIWGVDDDTLLAALSNAAETRDQFYKEQSAAAGK